MLSRFVRFTCCLPLWLLTAPLAYGAQFTANIGDTVGVKFRTIEPYGKAPNGLIASFYPLSGSYRGYQDWALYDGNSRLAAYSSSSVGAAVGYFGLPWDSATAFDSTTLAKGKLNGYITGKLTSGDALVFNPSSSVNVAPMFFTRSSGNQSADSVILSVDINGKPIWAAPSIKSIVAGAVKFGVTNDGIGMAGHFTPNFGLNLRTAAVIGGYDHFNWFQTVEKYPGFYCLLPLVTAPFVDPPMNGCRSLSPPVLADNLPFYWDENLDPHDPGYLLEDNIVDGGKTLQFIDYPSNSFVIPGVNQMKFYTYLAGVKSDGDFDLLTRPYIWSSDYNSLLGDGGITRSIQPVLGGMGGVTQGDFGTWADVGLDQQSLISAVGGAYVAEVPELPQWILFGFSLAIGWFSRNAFFIHSVKIRPRGYGC